MIWRAALIVGVAYFNYWAYMVKSDWSFLPRWLAAITVVALTICQAVWILSLKGRREQ